MTVSRTTRIALVTASLLGLAACGSDSDDSTDDAPDAPVTDGGGVQGGGAGAGDVGNGDDGGEGSAGTPPGTGNTDTGDTDTGDADDTDTGNAGAGTGNADDDIDLTDATPRIITSACGTLPVDDTASSSALGAPATLLEGRPVRARIDPDIVGNEVHYWQVDLQAGYHHVIVDSARLDGRDSNIGFEIDDVDAAGDSNEQLLSSNERGYRVRSVDFFVNSEPRTVALQVDPRYAGEDYVLGVFANGRSIPSPRFEDCPDISPLSLGTTEAVRLSDPDSIDDLEWYVVDLEQRAYLFDGLATRADGMDSNIGYRVASLEGFGDADTEDRVISVNERGTVSTDQDSFDPSSTGPVWLILEGLYTDTDLQFTVSPDGS